MADLPAGRQARQSIRWKLKQKAAARNFRYTFVVPGWRNGRRASLRSWYPQGCGGSSPLPGTNRFGAIVSPYGAFFCLPYSFRSSSVKTPAIFHFLGYPNSSISILRMKSDSGVS